MTDNAPTTTTITAPAPSASKDTSSPKPKPRKPNGKSRRARPRRRGGSDSESSDHHDSDHSSLTSLSDPETDEEEEDVAEEAVKETTGSKTKSTFPEASSTTPAAWADEKTKGETEEVIFDEFNREKSGATRGGAKDQGGKKVYTEEQTRRYEEKKARMKERQKAKRAELREAKIKEREAKESAEKLPPSSNTPEQANGEIKKAAKAKGKKREKEKVSAGGLSPVIASTSALTIDDTPSSADKASADTEPSAPAPTQTNEPDSAASTSRRPPSGPRNNTREAYAERLNKDPKFTPRVGGFWTHDQRHYDAGPLGESGYGGLRQMSGYWRGRGEPRGAFRGGFRGRGRGFGGFGPRGAFDQAPQGKGRELTDDVESESGKGQEKRLEMDKLEDELDQQRSKPVEQQEPEPLEEEVNPEEETNPVPIPPPVKAGKWGHEGFESMRAVDQFQANRSIRGRGRGRPFFIRGGAVPRPFFQHPLNGPFLPAARRQPSPLTVAPTENNSTQPTAETLMEDNSVKVKLPGSATEATLVQPEPQAGALTNGTSALHDSTESPSTEIKASASTSTSAFRAQAPVFVQSRSSASISAHPRPPVVPSHYNTAAIPAQPSPIPSTSAAIPTHPSAPSPQPNILSAGSENGSIPSNGHFVPSQQTYLPPGVGVTTNGEYYNIASAPSAQQRPYYPNQRQYAQQHTPQPYYPQSYSPDFFQHQSRHGSISSQPGQQPSFVDGRVSPYPSYPTGNGFFVPPRPSKISIRAPTAGDVAAAALNGVEGDDGLKRYPSIDQSSDGAVAPNGAYYAQHYNPYAGVAAPVNGGAGYVQGGGGQMMNGVDYSQGQQGYWTNGGDYGSYGEYGSW